MKKYDFGLEVTMSEGCIGIILSLVENVLEVIKEIIGKLTKWSIPQKFM